MHPLMTTTSKNGKDVAQYGVHTPADRSTIACSHRLHGADLISDMHVIMGVARIFQRGGHTDSYRGYSSDCHLNIVSCLLTRRLTKGEGVTGTPGPPLAAPMHVMINRPFSKMAAENSNTLE